MLHSKIIGAPNLIMNQLSGIRKSVPMIPEAELKTPKLMSQQTTIKTKRSASYSKKETGSGTTELNVKASQNLT